MVIELRIVDNSTTWLKDKNWHRNNNRPAFIINHKDWRYCEIIVNGEILRQWDEDN